MPISLEEFTRRLAESSLVAREVLDAVLATLSLGGDPDKEAERFARELVRLKKLTPFQVQQIYAGKGKSLLLGNYLLLEKLGQGGMGMVLKAEHRRMKRLVAIKILSPAVVKSPEAVKRFQREVEAAAKLIHPNIVTAFDADEANGTHFLVMEFVPGRDLSSIVAADGPLTISLAVDCIRQAARGLAFAHQNGIVHRDIKPANLLLDPQGTIKILDMGLARIDGIQPREAKEGLTQSGQVMGTVDYMAPEQAFDVRHADGRADIYSLGCTLFRLLTNTNLYEGETLVQKLMAHQQQPIPSLVERRPEVPMELEAVFRKMVAKKPEERYQTMAEVEAALGSLAAVHVAGQSNQPPASTAVPNKSPGLAATATLASPAADGYAPTISLTNPLQSTDPVSEVSIQVARQQTSQLVAPPKRPMWKQSVVLLGGIATLLLVSLGIWLIGNQRKKPVASITVPSDDSAKVVGDSWHGWPKGAPQPAIAPCSAEQARKHQDDWAALLKLPREWKNNRGMKFVLIPPGEFTMGSSPEELARWRNSIVKDGRSHEELESEMPAHKVILTEPFYLGAHEVTQNVYAKLMDYNPSSFARNGPKPELVAKIANLDTAEHPVETVSWTDGLEFCRRLSREEQLIPFDFQTGVRTANQQPIGYRLPTEAQWEFACRAGTTASWSVSSGEVSSVAWFAINSSQHSQIVGKRQANPFGLYDMHGNVSEWVLDAWEPTYYSRFEKQAAINPFNSSGGENWRVFRGGNWSHPSAVYCRSAGRSANVPLARGSGIGFRVALPVEAVRDLLNKTASEKPANNSGNFALELDGTTAWVQLPLLDDREGPLTIEAYVQPAEKLNRMATIGAAFVAPRGVGMTIFENKLEAAMSFVDEPTWSTAKTPQRPDSKIMSHVAAVFDGRTLKVFLNGKLSGQSELPQPHRPSRGSFALGGFEGRDLFAGQIDEVRFSKSARYIQDFSPKRRFEPDADTLALYHCDEGRGDELRDSSENGLHGKIIGGHWVPVTGNSTLSLAELYEALEFVPEPAPESIEPRPALSYNPAVLSALSEAMLMSAGCLLYLTLALAADLPAAEMPKVLDDRLKLELVLDSPAIATPTGIAVTEQGLVLVVENNSHFRPKDYPRAPHDRILAIKDTNNDGLPDETSVFLEGTKNTMNLAVHFDGSIYVATRSEIFRLTDKNQDGKADQTLAERDVLIKLETKGDYPHNGLSGFAFDLLGNVYFGFGENLGVEYKISGKDGKTLSGTEAGNIYYCRADGTLLRQMANGFWNPFHLCFDRYGRLFAVDNDPDSRPPCRLLHVIAGGDYGYRFRNGRKGIHPFTAWNGELPGTLPMVAGTGEAPCAVLAYESDQLPAEYRGELFVTSWGDHRLERYKLQPRGASFSAEMQPLIEGGENFRPVGLALAPDGSLFMSDWVDKSYQLHGKGRVWRLSAKEKPKLSRPIETVEALRSPHGPWREAAARKLTAEEAYDLVKTSKDGDIRSLAARALMGKLEVSPDAVKELDLASKTTGLLEWTLRISEMRGRTDPSGFDDFLKMIDDVLRGAKLGRVPLTLPNKPTLPLTNSSERQLSAGWIEIKELGDPFVMTYARDGYSSLAGDIDDGFAKSILKLAVPGMDRQAGFEKLNDPPLSKQHLSPRESEIRELYFAISLVTSALPETKTRAISRALKSSSPSVQSVAIIRIGEERLTEFRPDLENLLRTAQNRKVFEMTLAALDMLDLKPGEKIRETPGADYILKLLADEKTPPESLRICLRTIPANHAKLPLELLSKLTQHADAAVRIEAIRTLRERTGEPAAKLLAQIVATSNRNEIERMEALIGIATDADKHHELLESIVKTGSRLLKNEALRAMVGTEPVPPISATAWQALLSAPGDPIAGERLFFHPKVAACFRCHEQDGRGANIGPDLTVLRGTLTKERLLESLLTPSKEIAPRYTPWLIETKDGHVLTGLYVDEEVDGTLQLADPAGKIVRIHPREIETKKPSPKSIMPEGLLNQLTAQEARDLFAFLLQKPPGKP